MVLQKIRWICAVATCLCAPTSLFARQAEPWINAPLLRAGYPQPAARKHALKTWTLALLGPTDRNSLKTARAHGVEQSFGDFDLAIEAARLHGGRDSADEPMATGDRFNAGALVLTGGFDLGGGLHAGPMASFMHMRRRFSVVPAGLRPHSTRIATAGFGLWRDDGLTLSVDYVDAHTRAVRPLDRMAEILGGAPLAGRGLRLGLSGGDRDARAGSVTWGLNVSAMARPRQEFALTPVDGSLTDKRIAITIGTVF